MAALAVAGGLAGAAGCNGGKSTQGGTTTHEPSTSTVTETITDVALADYQKGYPKKVPLAKTDIPEGLQETAFSVDGPTFAWAVAPGVWVRYKPPRRLADVEQLGGLYGECDAVDAFAERVGERLSSSTCWE